MLTKPNWRPWSGWLGWLPRNTSIVGVHHHRPPHRLRKAPSRLHWPNNRLVPKRSRTPLRRRRRSNRASRRTFVFLCEDSCGARFLKLYPYNEGAAELQKACVRINVEELIDAYAEKLRRQRTGRRSAASDGGSHHRCPHEAQRGQGRRRMSAARNRLATVPTT